MNARLRKSLAVLLGDQLGFAMRRIGSGTRQTFAGGEAVLTQKRATESGVPPKSLRRWTPSPNGPGDEPEDWCVAGADEPDPAHGVTLAEWEPESVAAL